MKCFIYCRKSTESKDKQVQSLDTQEELLTEYAKRNDLEIIEIFRESASAWKENNRPKFDKMVERIKDKEVDVLLVISFDRIARNYIEAGIVRGLLKNQNIKEIRTQSETITDTTGLLNLGIYFLISEESSDSLSKNVKRGLSKKVRDGGYPGSAPIGYLNDKEKKIIYPDPLRSKYIERIFQLSAEKVSLREITETLFKEGFRTRYGNKVAISTIHRIVHNTTYYGLIDYKGKLYKGIHEPIITEQQFHKANQIVSRVDNPRPRVHFDRFMYKGYMICGICGCKYSASIVKNKLKNPYPYYHCTGARQKHKIDWLSESYVDEMFTNKITNIKIPEKIVRISLESYIQDVITNKEYKENQYQTLKDRLKEIDKLREKYADMLASERINENLFDKKNNELKSEALSIKDALRKLQGDESPEDIFEHLSSIVDKGITLPELFKTKDKQIKSDVLKSLVSNTHIRDRKIASIQYNLPYKLMVEIPKDANNLTWRG